MTNSESTPRVINKVRCHHCGDEPESKHVHDFRWCKCGAIAVDGGPYYAKRVGDLNNYTELSEGLRY